MKKLLVLTLILAALASPATVSAHEGHAHDEGDTPTSSQPQDTSTTAADDQATQQPQITNAENLATTKDDSNTPAIALMVLLTVAVVAGGAYYLNGKRKA